MLNLLSIIFGLIALALPGINFSQKETNSRKMALVLVMSISSCLISIFVQILEINRRIKIEDWTALTDTIDGTIWVSAILLIVIILLNSVSLFLFSNKAIK